ncbi:MAG TPA: glutaredoxin domain-containing protein [Candidatus Baltobacteraceae bacterium]
MGPGDSNKIDVEALGPGHRIELYIKSDCPYCAQAQAFYRSKGWAFESYDAQRDAAVRRRMLQLSSGDPTTPAIVVDGTYVQSGWGKPPRG